MQMTNHCLLYFVCSFMFARGSGELEVSVLNGPLRKEVKSCPYVYEARVPSAQDGLRNCTWYSGKACCKRTEVTSVFLGMLPLYTPEEMDISRSKHCRNLLNYMMCYFCDPNQADWYNRTLKVCEQFCIDVHSYCNEASYEGKTIGEQFASGVEFCKSQMFEVMSGDNKCFKFDPNVFDGSATLGSCLLTLALCIFVAFTIV